LAAQGSWTATGKGKTMTKPHRRTDLVVRPFCTITLNTRCTLSVAHLPPHARHRSRPDAIFRIGQTTRIPSGEFQ
jgi:hypothetical protein